MPSTQLLQPDTVVEGSFWSGTVRVLHARNHGSTVQIEAVDVVDSQYFDRTIPTEGSEGGTPTR